MRTGRVEEASALAKLIGTEIQKNNSVRLTKIQGKSETSTRQLWSAVRSLTCRKRDMSNTAGITADVLNEHFAQVSTDPSYTVSVAKLTTASENQDYFSEWAVFKALDTLHPTATGLDLLGFLGSVLQLSTNHLHRLPV